MREERKGEKWACVHGTDNADDNDDDDTCCTVERRERLLGHDPPNRDPKHKRQRERERGSTTLGMGETEAHTRIPFPPITHTGNNRQQRPSCLVAVAEEVGHGVVAPVLVPRVRAERKGKGREGKREGCGMAVVG